MNYDVVIATRNRPEALRLSIPLILKQGRPPKKLIIVDASDNHEQVRQAVMRVVVDFAVELEILNSKVNLTHQRNIGLKHVESPVVMFPDDDSFWWLGVGEAIMRIYERDTDGEVGGVCAADAEKWPPELDATTYEMSLSDHIRREIAGIRHKIDRRIRPSDLQILGRSYFNERPTPKWLDDENAVLVEFMGGARMSFRTELIRKYGFDEDLGAYLPAASCEDFDASFKVIREHLLIGARNAKVYHHRLSGRRGKGFELGFIQNFNRTYVISRYTLPESRVRRVHKRQAWLKMFKYVAYLRSSYGRNWFLGYLLCSDPWESCLTLRIAFCVSAIWRYVKMFFRLIGKDQTTLQNNVFVTTSQNPASGIGLLTTGFFLFLCWN